MGEFVGDDVSDALAFVLRGVRRVDEQRRLAERDAAQVLHGACGEVGEGHEVDLVGRVVDAVVVLEPAEAELADVQTERGEVGSAGHVHDPQGNAVGVDRVGRVQVPHDERHEVRAHLHRVGESDDGAPVGRRSFGLGTVGDGGQPVLHVEGDREHRLELRLVPARERPAAVGGLHLRRGDDLLVAVGVDERAAVEASELVVQDPGERDGQRRVARLDGSKPA